MQRRKKVGGILDRRFGENDPTMTPEEKALERFVKEKQRGNRKGAMFDLEDDEEDNQLTHFGESLSFERPSRLDDFKEADIVVSDAESSGESDGERPSKRRKTSRSLSSDEDLSDLGNFRQDERPKTKKEVMTEVIAKSKLHKYERQQAKEDDDDLRAELDKGLPDVYALLRGSTTQAQQAQQAQKPEAPNPSMNPDRAALLNGKDRSEADKEYDERLRQMLFDQRSKPTDRTKTEEEKLQQEAQRLKDLEERRLRRMRGEQESDDENDRNKRLDLQGDEDMEQNEDDTFGLGSGIAAQNGGRELGVEDEDEFIIEDTLVASELDEEISANRSENESENESNGDDEDDAEFIQGLLSKHDAGRDGLVSSLAQGGKSVADTRSGTLAYTYACPQSHKELLQITDNISVDDLPKVVQRIRALYHPKLHSENKAKLGTFSAVLVDHLSYLSNQSTRPSFMLLETLIRHIHSLAKTFAEEIGCAFRSLLKSMHEDRPMAPTTGDLVLLTAIASIFPTSDHFHQVVTPATLCITRYLSQRTPQSLTDLATGTYLGTLCLQYQRISKRYIPELINYILSTLWKLAPVEGNHVAEVFPYHRPASSLRIEGQPKRNELVPRQLRFLDIVHKDDASSSDNEEMKIALIDTHLKMVSNMADLWADKPAFCEVFEPISSALMHLTSKSCSSKLPDFINVSNTQLTFPSLSPQLKLSNPEPNDPDSPEPIQPP